MKRLLFAISLGLLLPATVAAAPYGRGKYNENVPYGSETALSISTNGDVHIPITPTENGTLATGTSNITVESTDVVGFKLYIRAATGSTDMVNGPDTLPTSANGSPAALATNTWGYNTDASSDFVGISASDALIKNAIGPYTAGEITTVTYGVKIDNSKPAGLYTTSVLYTAVPETD